MASNLREDVSFVLNRNLFFQFIFQVNFSSDTYFENVLDNIRSIAWSNSKKLREAVDKTEYMFIYNCNFIHFI